MQHKIILCTNCGKEIKRIGVMSPTLNAKRRCMCMACSKKIYTYPDLNELILDKDK
jgi:DNA-directed RNA polymerase subunit RPC12/RpoP